MIRLTLAQVAEIVGGELAQPDDRDRVVDAVTIDSRTAAPGALFVALPGEHVDGHEFIGDAAGRGAAGYLLAAGRLALASAPGGVVVDDPADALLGLGAWVRDTVDPVVVAVTGSQGKTSTKDLLAAAAGASRRTVAAPGSYNNDLGVPLTCCLLEADSEVLVTEVGTRGLGHIARLAPIVRPDIAVVTAVGASHLELLGDVDTVARAKAELVEALGPDGVAVLNADDARVAAMADRTAGRVVTYGRGAADWTAADVQLDRLARPRFTVHGPGGRTTAVALGVAGEHQVGNALAALAAADAAGADVDAAAAALAGARVSRWRMEVRERPDGLVVLNDAYNANPASMAGALATLARVDVTGRRWAVLGQMAELGAGSADAHAAVGRQAAALGLDGLVVVGAAAAGIAEAALAGAAFADGAVVRAADPEEALRLVRDRVRPGDAVLVKASRAVGLEALAEQLAAGGG
jgi:UDP-N-acetylmuramoyl-tripeptide--D-alanyl-D-alanine ligase